MKQLNFPEKITQPFLFSFQLRPIFPFFFKKIYRMKPLEMARLVPRRVVSYTGSSSLYPRPPIAVRFSNSNRSELESLPSSSSSSSSNTRRSSSTLIFAIAAGAGGRRVTGAAGSPSYRHFWPHGRQSSPTITLTG